MVKNLPATQENLGLIPGLGRSPGGGHGNPLKYSCLENPHGQRSLAGYSPWGHEPSDMTEQLSTHMDGCVPLPFTRNCHNIASYTPIKILKFFKRERNHTFGRS